jgi:hypothetical protein
MPICEAGLAGCVLLQMLGLSEAGDRWLFSAKDPTWSGANINRQTGFRLGRARDGGGRPLPNMRLKQGNCDCIHEININFASNWLAGRV